MSWWTVQRARQLYSMPMWLWMMVCRERVRRQFEHPGVGGVLQETQGSRERVFLLQSRRCASFIGNDMDATVSRYFFIFHFFVFFFFFIF